jgi:predicted hydrocarbon binding protein
MPLKEKVPNQLLFLTFVTVQEILGKNGLNSILNYAKLLDYIDNYPPNTLDQKHPFYDFTRFVSGMVEVLGEKGARSIMLQSGLKGFKNMLIDMPELFALKGVQVGKGPPEKLFDEYVRIETMMVEAGRGIFGDVHTDYTTDKGWCLELSPCYWCVGLTSTVPICYAEVGFELGVARWILGPDARVEETHCIARGDPMCRFITYRPKI